MKGIHPPPDAQAQESHSTVKTDQADIVIRYATALSYDKVTEYYDTELEATGWVYLGEHSITYAATGRYYCKGEDATSIEYFGVGYQWKYELILSWGHPIGCQEVKGGAHQFVVLSNLGFLLAGSLAWVLYGLLIQWFTWILKPAEFSGYIRQIVGRPLGVWRMRLNSGLVFLLGMLGTIISVLGIVSVT